MAHAYARLEKLPQARTITDAMRACPELVGGPDGFDFHLMRTAHSWFAKGGAEGLLCAADGTTGIALKSEDGSSRPLGPALAAFLAPLGVALPDLETHPVTNSRGDLVGELRVTTS
jgi:L-asparaginase II